MDQTCPKCSMKLPEMETLEYRFCPGCGTEISATPEQLDETLQTIPPDLSMQQPGLPGDLEPKIGKKDIFTQKFNDKTIAPHSRDRSQQPGLKPPNTPPPAGFFRKRAAENPNSIGSAKEVPPKKVIQKQSSAKNRKTIIAIIIILAVILLVLGGLFTF